MTAPIITPMSDNERFVVETVCAYNWIDSPQLHRFTFAALLHLIKAGILQPTPPFDQMHPDDLGDWMQKRLALTLETGSQAQRQLDTILDSDYPATKVSSISWDIEKHDELRSLAVTYSLTGEDADQITRVVLAPCTSRAARQLAFELEDLGLHTRDLLIIQIRTGEEFALEMAQQAQDGQADEGEGEDRARWMREMG